MESQLLEKQRSVWALEGSFGSPCSHKGTLTKDFVGGHVVSAPTLAGNFLLCWVLSFLWYSSNSHCLNWKVKKVIIQRESLRSSKIFHSALRHETINCPTIIIAENCFSLLSNYLRKSLCPLNLKAFQFLREKKKLPNFTQQDNKKSIYDQICIYNLDLKLLFSA